MAGSYLCFAEEKRGVMPAAVERIHHGVGHRRHLGFVLAKSADGGVDVHHKLVAIEPEIVRGQRDVAAFVLQHMNQPVREFDIAIAGALRLPQRLEQGLIADAVELACDGLKIDVGHLRLLRCGLAACVVCCPCAPPGGTWRRGDRLPSCSSPAPSSSSSRADRTGRGGWAGPRAMGWPAPHPNRAGRRCRNRRGPRAARTDRRWAEIACIARGSGCRCGSGSCPERYRRLGPALSLRQARYGACPKSYIPERRASAAFRRTHRLPP